MPCAVGARLTVVFWAGLLGFLGVAPDHVRADQWVALFYHIHTTYSNEELEWAAPIKLTVRQVFDRADGFAESLKLPGAAAITDHNNWNATADGDFRPVGRVRPIAGMEWEVELGEITVLGQLDQQLTGSLRRGADRATFEKAVEAIHSQNGFVTVCHPRSKVRWHADKRLGVDGIEVWNGIGWKTWDDDALVWWNQLLVEGERITGLGGSDAHTVLHPVECPMNLVFAKSNSPDDVLTAMRAGRVLVLSGPKAPRPFLVADTNDDGVYDDAMTGDLLPNHREETVRFQVTVEGAEPGQQLVLTDRDGAFVTGEIGAGPGWDGNVYRFERSFARGQANFLRAEVRRPDGKTVESLGNPIYVPAKDGAGR